MHLPYLILILFYVIYSSGVDGKTFSASNEFDDHNLNVSKLRAKRDTTMVQQILNDVANGCKNQLVIITKDADSTKIKNATRNRRWLVDGSRVLVDWQNGRPSDGPTGPTTEQSFGTIRLDRQGEFTKDEVDFVNFQLQINNRSEPFPTSIANVNIQKTIRNHDVSDMKRLIRHSFRISLNNAATVEIKERVVDKNGKPTTVIECESAAESLEFDNNDYTSQTLPTV